MSKFPNIGKSDLNPFPSDPSNVSGMFAGKEIFKDRKLDNNMLPQGAKLDPIVPDLPSTVNIPQNKKLKFPGEPNNDELKRTDFH